MKLWLLFPYLKQTTCVGKPPRLGSSWSCTARRAMATYKTHSIGGNLREAPTAEKVNKSDQTKHVSRNISFEIWANISQKIARSEKQSTSFIIFILVIVYVSVLKALVNVPNPRHCREICAGKAKTSSSWVCANCGSQNESQNLLWP